MFILILIVCVLYKKSEPLTNLEAINNLTTLYTDNSKSVQLNNLDISGNLDVRGNTKFKNVDISGNLNVKGEITGNFINIQGIRARYIEIGNDNTGILDVINDVNWQISEVVIIDSSGNNIVKGITPTLEIGEIRQDAESTRKLGNITDGILSIDAPDNIFVANGQAKIKIDLGEEKNIVQINLHNRNNYMASMNGTYIRLLDKNEKVTKIIYTGVWNNDYSKEFLL